MIVSIHATRHPVEGAGFLTLERNTFADERRRLDERRAEWLAACPEDVRVGVVAVPQAIVDSGVLPMAI